MSAGGSCQNDFVGFGPGKETGSLALSSMALANAVILSLHGVTSDERRVVVVRRLQVPTLDLCPAIFDWLKLNGPFVIHIRNDDKGT
jgi:hypothetical protein